MRPYAAALLLALSQDTPTPLADPVEPPTRVDVRVGERTVRLELGVARPASDGLPELRAELTPTREFVAPRAFAFEFPREWTFSGAGNGAQGWWSVNGRGAMVHMQRHTDDPIAIRDQYAKNLLAGQSGATASDCTLVLGGRELQGRSVQFTQGSFDHAPAENVRQDVYGFRAGGASWLLVLNHSLGTVDDTLEFVVFEGLRPRTIPHFPASTITTSELDAVITSFRWL